MTRQRKIVHIDMDAFYAAVEQRDNPDLRGRPIVVGGAPDSRGVVATCSYEARRFGVHSAMPSSQAQRLCPETIFLKPRFDVYRRISVQIRAVFRRYTRLVEPLSLDEAYLDVTETRQFRGSATLIAQDIKRSVAEETSLIASAGVSYNKFLAKLASDMDKPDGLFLITPQQGGAFVEGLPISRFHGVGNATEAKMKALGIHTGADLKRWPLERLLSTFGKAGKYYYYAARGIDERPVMAQRERKSLGAETTFSRDLSDRSDMLRRLEGLAAEVSAALASHRLMGNTLTLKVKYANFQQVTRSMTFRDPLQSSHEICAVLPRLLSKTDAHMRSVRLLGVTVSRLCPEQISQAQGDLFRGLAGPDGPNPSR